MNFIYLTSKKYPSKTADHFFVKEMANAFGKILSSKFSLVLADDSSEYFKNISVVNTGIKKERGRTLYYFFWLPYFIIKKGFNNLETFVFTNDPNLLVDLIILKKLFRFKYKVCSEWHMLYDDWRDSFIVKNSDFLVATSEKLKRTIIERVGVDERDVRFLVVYGGVNIEKYNNFTKDILREQLLLPKDKILVAYIGLFKTLGAKKGIDVMIESLKHLPDNINMVFVGGRPEEINEYLSQITDTSIKGRCIFIERQESERVPLFQQAVDILVLPAPDKHPFNDYLLPMKVYEYLASQKPIIYSRLDILEEVLGSCAYGFIPEDSADLATKVLLIVSMSPEKIKEKTDLCYKKASEASWSHRAQNIIDWLGNNW